MAGPPLLTLVTRDGLLCRYCGASLAITEVTVDHVMPRSRGGSNDVNNLVVCCEPCNIAKEDRTPDEMGWQLRPPQPRERRRFSKSERRALRAARQERASFAQDRALKRAEAREAMERKRRERAARRAAA